MSRNSQVVETLSFFQAERLNPTPYGVDLGSIRFVVLLWSRWVSLIERNVKSQGERNVKKRKNP